MSIQGLDRLDVSSTSDHDSSTAYGGADTPPVTVADLLNEPNILGKPRYNSSAPWPGSTFIIRSAESGRVLTLLDGQLILASPGTRGSIHWECIQTNGWIGFKNTVSGRFLGHDKVGRLRCISSAHEWWEYFCPRSTPDGGYVLMMTNYSKLWHVGSRVDDGKLVLAKISEKSEDAMIWEFTKVA